MTADLAAWLLADDGPIAEDERIAQAAIAGPWEWLTEPDNWGGTRTTLISPTVRWYPDVRHPSTPPDGYETTVISASGLHTEGFVDVEEADAAHIARWDPARVLAECAAKRKIIALHAPMTPHRECPTCRENGGNHGNYPCDTLLALAQPYAGRPGWREEWTT